MPSPVTTHEFSSPDLRIGSLIYSQHPEWLLRVDRDNGRCWFVFKERQQCEAIQQSFYNNSAIVHARDFTAAQEALKDIIFARERSI